MHFARIGHYLAVPCAYANIADPLSIWFLFRCFAPVPPWPILYVNNERDIESVLRQMTVFKLNETDEKRLQKIIR